MMVRSLWTGATGMRAQQFNIDSIAHDLTNVNTTGYKKMHLSFSDLFYQGIKAAGLQGGENNTPVGIQVGHGVRVSGTTPIFTRGGSVETGIWSDMMIEDNGPAANNFFGVTLPDGTTAYTRDGSFRVNDQGEITTTNGLSFATPVAGIPAGALESHVTASGQVVYRDQVGGAQTVAGQVFLYSFPNPAGLRAVGDNMFVATEASGDATQGTPDVGGFGSIRGGWLETSNVDAITEMVNMISAQRAYEFNSRTIQTSDEMMQTVNNLKR